MKVVHSGHLTYMFLFKMASGSHFGFMQISRFVQTRHSGNQSDFVRGSNKSTNQYSRLVN